MHCVKKHCKTKQDDTIRLVWFTDSTVAIPSYLTDPSLALMGQFHLQDGVILGNILPITGY